MTILLSILGALASVIGIYAFYRALITERHKLFAYEVSRGIAVASASRIGGDYELSVHFKAAGGSEEKIEGAYLQFVRFANLGRESIYRHDNASGNPIRIEVKGARVLDIAIADVRRGVNQIELSPPVLSEDEGTAQLEFDFLDYRDGALVRVLTAGEAEAIEISGDVIGMPSGIVCTAVEKASGIPFKIGFTLWAVAELSLFGFTAWLYRTVFESWEHVWILGVPIAALIAPLIAAIIIDESGSKLRRASWRRRAYPDFKFPSGYPYGRFAFDFPPFLPEPTIAADKDAT